MAKARFLVVAPHDPDECLDAIEATLNQGPGFQEAYEWGCFVGNHTGYVFVRASGAEEAVTDYVPTFLRSRATAYRVKPIPARELHEMRDREKAERRG